MDFSVWSKEVKPAKPHPKHLSCFILPKNHRPLLHRTMGSMQSDEVWADSQIYCLELALMSNSVVIEYENRAKVLSFTKNSHMDLLIWVVSCVHSPVLFLCSSIYLSVINLWCLLCSVWPLAKNFSNVLLKWKSNVFLSWVAGKAGHI